MRPGATNTSISVWVIIGLVWLVAGLVPATGHAQPVLRVVTTVLDGDPFSRSDLQSDFRAGERLSINIIMDT